MEDMQDLEGLDEMLTKFLESLPLERRLAGLEQNEAVVAKVLESLPPERRLLAMPDDALAALSPAFVASLPAHVQEAIRERLARR